jgi:hypothetical protein
MGYENIGRLIDHWINYAPFRAALRENPAEAVRQSGIRLSPEEEKLLGQIDWSLSDEALQERISKLFG